MSREILKSFSFHKDFLGFDASGYSSNVYPKIAHKFTNRAQENETVINYVKGFVKDVIYNCIELPKNNKLNLYVMLLDENVEEYQYYSKENRDKWKNDEETYETIWLDEEAKKECEECKRKFDENLTKIAQAFINGSLDNKIKQLKKEKYIITNGGIYITKFSKRGYHYSSDETRAKILNGIQLLTIPNYLKRDFEVKKID